MYRENDTQFAASGPVAERGVPEWSRRLRRLVVDLLAVLIAVPLAMVAEPAAAKGRAVMQELPPGVCLNTQDCSPPKLLNLNQSLYAATPAQVTSLRKLEEDAVEDVIEEHGLSDGDTKAVQTWGRHEALAHLWTLLLEAIGTDVNGRTDDQKNAVDWLTTLTHRKAIASAHAVGGEYVKWAGLNQSAYWALANGSPSESELKAFLDDTPLNFNNPNASAATGGWCKYRSPAPYGSDYTGYNDRSCLAHCSNGVLPCSPPTPSYEQFVKWGEASASYSFLSSADFAKTAHKVGLASAVGLAAVAPLVAGVGPVVVSQVARQLSIRATSPAMMTAGFGAIGATFATVIIVAVVIAVVHGIAVINASQLPGQLAELIADARANAPDVKSLIGTSDGAASLYALFLGATLPTPADDTCDNSALPRGIVVLEGVVQISGGRPCLNPSPIPPASAVDPQFMIQADGSPSQTRSATITWKDSTAGTTTTARLHKNWFITETNGSAAQTLRITYTDWGGKQRHAFLLGDAADGHKFVSLHVSDDFGTRFDLATCIDNGLCKESDTLQYLAPDGTKMSAKVEPYVASTGTPKYVPGDEGQALSFDANGFKPGNAEGDDQLPVALPERAGHAVPVGRSTLRRRPTELRSPVPSSATPGSTAGSSSSSSPRPTAVGRTGTTTFPVTVGNVPPTLHLLPDCAPPALILCFPRTGQAGTPMDLFASFDDVGVFSQLTVSVDWGDGTPVVSNCISGSAGCLTLFDPNFDLSRSTDRQYFVLDAAHTYAAPGTYYGRVSVSDGGAVDSETFVMTIPTAPAVPTGLQAIPAPQDGLDEGQVRLVWDPPANNGAAITDYVIESSADGTTWTAVADGVSTATTYIVTGLTNGTNYRFRVAARNAIGIGPSSTPVEATPAWVPAAPAGLTPAAGVGQVTLTWNAPADNGAAITDYVVESSARRDDVDHGRRRRVDGDDVHGERPHRRDPVLVPGGGQERRRGRPVEHVGRGHAGGVAGGSSGADAVDGAGGRGRVRTGEADLDRPGGQRIGGHRLRHPDLPRRDDVDDRRRRRVDGDDVHGERAHQRNPVLVPGRRQERRRGRSVEHVGRGHAGRSAERSGRVDGRRADRRARLPGPADLERSGGQRISGHRLRHPDLPRRDDVDHRRRRCVDGDDVHGERAPQRPPLLVPGGRQERRRDWSVEPGGQGHLGPVLIPTG